MAKPNHSANDHNHFPWSHVVGFILSIVLTLVALWVAFNSGFSMTVIIWIIVILAVFQAILQLFMFMHITESENKIWQTWNIAFAFFTAFTVVAGSIWVMAFGMHY